MLDSEYYLATGTKFFRLVGDQDGSVAGVTGPGHQVGIGRPGGLDVFHGGEPGTR